LKVASGELAYIVLKLIAGGVAAILAIAFWSQTRDAPWLFVVLGIMAYYGESLFMSLRLLGIDAALPSFNGIPVFDALFAALPPLFFSAAFIIMLVRKSRGRV
jgi:hypothetical protein